MFQIRVECYEFSGRLGLIDIFTIDGMPDSMYSLMYIIEHRLPRLYHINYVMQIKEISSGDTTRRLVLNNK